MVTAVRRRYDLLSASVKVTLAVIRECRTALAALHNYTVLTLPMTEREETKTRDSVQTL